MKNIFIYTAISASIGPIYIITCLIHSVFKNDLFKDVVVKIVFGGWILLAIDFLFEELLPCFGLNYPLKSTYLGSGLSVMVYAVALAERFNKEHKELKYLKNNLEKQIIIRTDELRIAHAEREMSFVNLAHEIKSPITVLNNILSSYIRQVGINDDLKEIKNTVSELIRKTTNFFDIEKIVKGKHLYNHDQIVNFSNIIELKLPAYKKYALTKNICLKSSIIKNIYIKADPAAIDSILGNLLDNAIKYSKADGGNINIELSKVDSYANLLVSDTGIGIEKDQIDNIFIAYHQCSSEKLNKQGIGAGLYITKKLVNELNGCISVKSIYGVESQFNVQIPLTFDSKLQCNNLIDFISDPIDKKQYVFDDLPEIDEQKFTILIVEDDLSLLYSMEVYFKKFYNTICATSGKNALFKLNKCKPDLIISDIMMDEINGYELLKAVREKPSLKEIPFVFMTAKTGISEEIEGLTSGAIDFITKPFDLSVVKAHIDTLINYNVLIRELFEMQKYKHVGMLTASICHEILNPLAGIKGSFDVVEDIVEQYNNENLLQEGIQNVKENIQRISDIVTTLRSLFHGDRIILEKIKVVEIIKSVIELYKDRVGSKIEFRLNIDANTVVLANKSALTQILMNLITNAAEAIKEKGVIHFEYDNNKLVVGDNGCGISEKNLKKIFNITFSTKRDIGCTGIGLFIVKEITERMGIEIKVESILEEGTKVYLIFPNEST